MIAGQRVSSTHRGAPARRNWTPTRADLVAHFGTDDLPDLTDAQCSVWTRCVALNETPTQVARTFDVTIQTVTQHLAAATAKLERWQPAHGSHSTSTAPPAVSDDDWGRLERRLAAIEAERAELREVMEGGASATLADLYEADRWQQALQAGPRRDVPGGFDQWELELVHRRMVAEIRSRARGIPPTAAGFLRAEDYSTAFLLDQDFIRARIDAIPKRAAVSSGTPQERPVSRCPAGRRAPLRGVTDSEISGRRLGFTGR